MKVPISVYTIQYTPDIFHTPHRIQTCHPRLDGSLDSAAAPPASIGPSAAAPAVVVVQSATMIDSSSDTDDVSDRLKYSLAQQLLQVTIPTGARNILHRPAFDDVETELTDVI